MAPLRFQVSGHLKAPGEAVSKKNKHIPVFSVFWRVLKKSRIFCAKVHFFELFFGILLKFNFANKRAVFPATACENLFSKKSGKTPAVALKNTTKYFYLIKYNSSPDQILMSEWSNKFSWERKNLFFSTILKWNQSHLGINAVSAGARGRPRQRPGKPEAGPGGVRAKKINRGTGPAGAGGAIFF